VSAALLNPFARPQADVQHA